MKDFRRETNKRKVKFAYINAMSLKQAKDIYKVLNYEIFGQPEKTKKRGDRSLELYEKLISN